MGAPAGYGMRLLVAVVFAAEARVRVPRRSGVAAAAATAAVAAVATALAVVQVVRMSSLLAAHGSCQWGVGEA